MIGLRPIVRHFELPAGVIRAPVVLGAFDQVGLHRRVDFAEWQRGRIAAQSCDRRDENVRRRYANLQSVQVGRLMHRPAHVIERARSGVVDRQADQLASSELLQHLGAGLTVRGAPHVLDGVEDIRQREHAGGRKRVVERREVHAHDVESAEARQIHGIRFSAQLARVIDANSQATIGLRSDPLAHPTHGLHGRIAVDVHVCCSHQPFAVERCGCARVRGTERSQADEGIAPVHALLARGVARTARHPTSPKPWKMCCERWPGRMLCTPVIIPVEMTAPACSGRPRRAALASVNASAPSGPWRTDVTPRPTNSSSMNVCAVTSYNPRQSSTAVPTTTPQLLPKSATTAPGPRSFNVASGLLAISIPMHSSPTKSAASSSVHSNLSGGASRPTQSTISASTAANPPSNTGQSIVRPGAATWTLGAKIGPIRRSSAYWLC